jgi:hypothetical protein
MPRTTRLTSLLAGRGKAAAAAAAAAAVLAGAGTASAAALTGAAPATHTTAAAHVTAAHATAAPAASHAQPAAARPTPAKAAPAKPAPAPARPAPAQRAAPAAAPKPAAPAPAQPYQVYDSVTPSAIPAGAHVATYADGGYAVPAAQVASRGHVTWIDTNGSDPRAAALDVEPGDATPAGAATWAWHKLHDAANSVAIIYTMRSEWAATQAAVATLPASMQHQVRWWIADPTGAPHIVPGADATQWYWGHSYDITTARPGSGL